MKPYYWVWESGGRYATFKEAQQVALDYVLFHKKSVTVWRTDDRITAVGEMWWFAGDVSWREIK